MTMFGMATAQLLFEESDRLWLLSSTDTFARGRALHRNQPKDAQLIPVPVLRWSRKLTVLRMVVDDPFEAIRQQQDLLDKEYRDRSQQFLEQLTPRERQIVEVFVRDPSLSNAEIGSKQAVALATQAVASFFTTIYDKAYSFYGLREAAKGKREVLVGLLAPYFSWIDQRSPVSDNIAQSDQN